MAEEDVTWKNEVLFRSQFSSFSLEDKTVAVGEVVDRDQGMNRENDVMLDKPLT